MYGQHSLPPLKETKYLLFEKYVYHVKFAIFVGAGLAVSGAIMQGLTRNPLADPGLLGLSGGANAALALTLAFNPSISYLYLTLACFIGPQLAQLWYLELVW